MAIHGLSTGMPGLCIGSIMAGFLPGGFVSGRIARRHALTTMTIAGRIVACIDPLAALHVLRTDRNKARTRSESPA